MDKTIRDKELKIENLKQLLSDEEKTRLYLEEQVNTYKQEIKQLNLNIQDINKEKHLIETNYNEEISKIKHDLNKQIELKAKHEVKIDIGNEELRTENENLRFNLNKIMREMETCKKELSDNLDKITRIENIKTQMNQDWQRRYQLLENIKAQDAEAFTKQVMESRDQALNRVKVLEDQLTHKENVIKALQTAEPSMSLSHFESAEFQLKEENEKLKQIIKQMREEMENIASEPEQRIPTKLNSNGYSEHKNNHDLVKPQPVLITTPLVNPNAGKVEFEEDLKKQVLDLKQKNRHLQAQLDDIITKQKLPDNITDNTIINSHIKSLNDTINTLRKEKVDLTTFCKKQQTKLIHIEKMLNEQNEQMRQRQSQIETLQYEMNSQTRRSTNEINNLKQTLANLELELNTTRREADEYHKVAIEKNTEMSALETKISELKLKLSTSGTQLNFGAQELFIQQLQDEIKRVNAVNQQLQIKARQQHHQLLREQQNVKSSPSKPASSSSCSSSNGVFEDPVSTSSLSSPPSSLNELTLRKEADGLKSKLKTAAKFISQLIHEKEHLIEMSNQLRGELNRIKFDNENLAIQRINRETSNHILYSERPVSPVTPRKHQHKSPSRTALDNKLEQLEKKQYELTKKVNFI